jgi:hypothetical protein
MKAHVFAQGVLIDPLHSLTIYPLVEFWRDPSKKSISLTQDLMRHSDPATTLKWYSRPSTAKLAEFVEGGGVSQVAGWCRSWSIRVCSWEPSLVGRLLLY